MPESPEVTGSAGLPPTGGFLRFTEGRAGRVVVTGEGSRRLPDPDHVGRSAPSPRFGAYGPARPEGQPLWSRPPPPSSPTGWSSSAIPPAPRPSPGRSTVIGSPTGSRSGRRRRADRPASRRPEAPPPKRLAGRSRETVLTAGPAASSPAGSPSGPDSPRPPEPRFRARPRRDASNSTAASCDATLAPGRRSPRGCPRRALRRCAPALAAEGGVGATPEEVEYLRIAAIEPRWGAELGETSLPLAAGLSAHVRLGKGLLHRSGIRRPPGAPRPNTAAAPPPRGSPRTQPRCPGRRGSDVRREAGGPGHERRAATRRVVRDRRGARARDPPRRGDRFRRHRRRRTPREDRRLDLTGLPDPAAGSGRRSPGSGVARKVTFFVMRTGKNSLTMTTLVLGILLALLGCAASFVVGRASGERRGRREARADIGAIARDAVATTGGAARAGFAEAANAAVAQLRQSAVSERKLTVASLSGVAGASQGVHRGGARKGRRARPATRGSPRDAPRDGARSRRAGCARSRAAPTAFATPCAATGRRADAGAKSSFGTSSKPPGCAITATSPRRPR